MDDETLETIRSVLARAAAVRRAPTPSGSKMTAARAAPPSNERGQSSAITSLAPFTSAAFISRATPLLHHVLVKGVNRELDGESTMMQERILTGPSASEMKATSCLAQGLCCSSHYPEGCALRLTEDASPPEQVQRAAIATAEAAFRASHRGFVVVSSTYLGFFAEVGLTELVVRGGLQQRGEDEEEHGDGDGSGGVIADLRTALKADLKRGANAKAKAKANNNNNNNNNNNSSSSSSTSSSSTMIKDELDALDAGLMMRILDDSRAAAAALKVKGESEKGAGHPEAAGENGEGDDSMVAMATVSLFVSKEGRLLLPLKSAAAVVAESKDTNDDGDNHRGGFLHALKSTLRTSFSSLRQTGLKEASFWLDYRRNPRSLGNLLLLDACRLLMASPSSSPSAQTQTEEKASAVTALEITPFPLSHSAACSSSLLIEEEAWLLVKTALRAKRALDERRYDPRPFVPLRHQHKEGRAEEEEEEEENGDDGLLSLSALGSTTGAPTAASRSASESRPASNSAALLSCSRRARLPLPSLLPSERRPLLLRVTRRAQLLPFDFAAASGSGPTPAAPPHHPHPPLASVTIMVPLLPLMQKAFDLAGRCSDSASEAGPAAPLALAQLEHRFTSLGLTATVTIRGRMENPSHWSPLRVFFSLAVEDATGTSHSSSSASSNLASALVYSSQQQSRAAAAREKKKETDRDDHDEGAHALINSAFAGLGAFPSTGLTLTCLGKVAPVASSSSYFSAPSSSASSSSLGDVVVELLPVAEF